MPSSFLPASWSRALLSVAAVSLIGSLSIARAEPVTAPAPQQSVTDVAAAMRTKHVFIISFDGGKPAVMQKSKMPTLFSLVDQGACTWEAHTILPSITLVSHTSMLTGVAPAKHKVDWNDWKPEKGIVGVPTVFSLARPKGLITAVFAGKEKFQHLNIPGSLNTFSVPSYNAQRLAKVAATYIEVIRPNLCFIHFAESDGAGHQYGWGSPEQMQSFADEDAALTIVMDAIRKAGIAKTSVVILSADHGGHDKHHGTDSPEDVNIPWIAWGEGVKPGFKVTTPVTTYDTAATALWLLGVPIPADWDGKPITSAFAASAPTTR